ncbi:MAG: hypothetical protein IJP78_04050 [Clostridia bacterium]|nr:hypothetical protein [Clostridia bacterium]
MSDRNDRPSVASVFKVGTPECAVFSCAAAVGVGLLLLLVGFWNTVWIALLGAAGAFLGGVRNKKEVLKSVLNRVIPDKKTILYRGEHPDIIKAVREATAKTDSAEKGESEPEQEQESEQE